MLDEQELTSSGSEPSHAVQNADDSVSNIQVPRSTQQVVNVSITELQKIVDDAVKQALDKSDNTQLSHDEDSDVESESDAMLLDQEVVTLAEVTPALEKTIKKRLKERMSNEVLTKKKETYKGVPANLADAFKPTLINKELFSSLPVWAKTKDKRFVEPILQILKQNM